MKKYIILIFRFIWNILFIKPKIIILRILGAKIGKNVKILTKLSNLDLKFVHLLTIEDNVTIAKECLVFTHDGAATRLKKFNISKEQFLPVVIEANVFIGAGAIILPGVSLGENVIIGAGSVVTKSFSKNCIVAGNPAKVLKEFTGFSL